MEITRITPFLKSLARFRHKNAAKRTATIPNPHNPNNAIVAATTKKIKNIEDKWY
jgi:hypothetical protein